MKKSIFALSLLAMLSVALLIACSGSENKSQTATPATSKEQYQCPMKCTEELFDKPGKCPVCEMDLEKVSNS
jgi:hypothetical protein